MEAAPLAEPSLLLLFAFGAVGLVVLCVIALIPFLVFRAINNYYIDGDSILLKLLLFPLWLTTGVISAVLSVFIFTMAIMGIIETVQKLMGLR